MKKLILASLILMFSGIFEVVKADEGMWLPMFIKRLNYVDMQKEGLQLTAEEIYSINHASLKDAIVQFDGGCTAEVISDQGLLLTNHHCGYSAIANHSTKDHDYLTDGFWAYNKSEELTNEGMTVSFLDHMADVTDRVNAVVKPEMTLEEKNAAIKQIVAQISSEESKDGLKGQVKSFFNGNEFYLFVYKIYTDIRLVGAPPSSIGKYGGDTDNWMWPRHTGDFSMFRIYANKDNEPAIYSEDNVPYKAAYHLPISIKGIQDGDFAMIMGYPGSTDRYLSSWGVQQKIGVEYPAFVASRDLKLKIMKKYMDADATVRINYSPRYAQTANYWKNRDGMIKALTKNKTVAKKEKIEAELEKWINANPERKKEYGNIFDVYKKYYSTTDATIAGDQYLMEAGLMGSNFGLFNFRLSQKMDAIMKAEDEESAKKIIESTNNYIDEFFDGISLPLERELTSKMFAFYYKNAPIEQQPEEFVAIVKEYNNDFDALAKAIFETSIITNRDKLKETLVNLKDEKMEETLKNDVGVKAYYSFLAKYLVDTYSNPEKVALKDELNGAKKLFIKALRESNPDKSYYPDANFTMRLTYGQVMSYEPKDGVEYKFYTTLKGVMQKEDATNAEFVVAPKLKELYESKDYGQYANADGTMPVAFLTNNDITGGNSGSPVINGKGELIGAAFDGNWEAMSGDIEFSNELQRTISVDVRYILFIIDKYAGATNLIDEMTIVKN
jgi:hypothetical protein